MTEIKQPQFILNEQWAIGLNNLNWIIYQARHNKDGDPSGYKAVAYYPTPEQMLEGLLRKIMLVETDEPDLVQHINHALRAATAVYSAFTELIEALPPIPDKATLYHALSQEKAA